MNATYLLTWPYALYECPSGSAVYRDVAFFDSVHDVPTRLFRVQEKTRGRKRNWNSSRSRSRLGSWRRISRRIWRSGEMTPVARSSRRTCSANLSTPKFPGGHRHDEDKTHNDDDDSAGRRGPTTAGRRRVRPD